MEHCSVPVELISPVVLNKFDSSSLCSHNIRFAECTKCKGKKNIEKDFKKYIESLITEQWLLDSGASLHFTFNKDDLIDIEELEHPIPLKTANSMTKITAKGMALIRQYNKLYKLDSVYYMPDLNQRLISLGQLHNDGFESYGNNQRIVVEDKEGNRFLSFTKLFAEDALYWLHHTKQSLQFVCDHGFVYILNYDLMHQRVGHPSDVVLHHMKKHTKGFPEIPIPLETPLCRGCAEGKLPLCAFPPSNLRASRIFELVHTDLKEFPILSYHKYKYTMVFLDDHSSHAWIFQLCTKAAAIHATRHFLANMHKSGFG
jgi:hypothetical protein